MLDKARDLTTSEAAEVLGVSREWVAQLIDAGKLPGRRVGTHRRVSANDVARYRANRAAAQRREIGRFLTDADDDGAI